MNKWLKILAIILILGVVVILVGYFYINKPHPDFAQLEASYTLEAEALFNDFAEAAQTASEKYNGKMLLVHGQLAGIEKTADRVIAVFVYKRGLFGDEGIRCTLLPDFDRGINNLKPGDEIMIKGFCSGYNGTDVILEKCSLPQ